MAHLIQGGTALVEITDVPRIPRHLFRVGEPLTVTIEHQGYLHKDRISDVYIHV